ncbi:hypothetical protein ACIHCQ_04755 [Streptomyces sp. NPDC052236]|uniref:hypothetical protein n=1 Tax=Streptomyces sp. NPDC052236 TaxID=3365686 RepID=UPI0037D0BBD1
MGVVALSQPLIALVLSHPSGKVHKLRGRAEQNPAGLVRTSVQVPSNQRPTSSVG